MALKFIDEIELEGKVVIARFDFNVPFEKGAGSKTISDTTRIDSALKTINYILDNGAKQLILMSHLGRPKGQVNQDFSLEPVATYLAEVLDTDVLLTESCLDRGIKTLLNLNKPKVILLQNLRFHKEEEENDSEFARTLSSYADIYVNDAFGTAHRKHASTYEISKYFDANSKVGGFLLKSEVNALTKITGKPTSPFVAIIGGAKVSDKIKIIEQLINKVDHMLIGGAMAYPFLKAQGKSVGKSLCSDEDVLLAKKILGTPSAVKLVIPVDHLGSLEFGGTAQAIESANIPEELMALDIGPRTIELYRSKLMNSKTVLWNGPMGLFENEAFSKGTFSMASTLAELQDTFTLVGGGDSVSAVKKSDLASKMSHVSTGGGASLEFIEQESLPGINALKFQI